MVGVGNEVDKPRYNKDLRGCWHVHQSNILMVQNQLREITPMVTA